MSFIVREVLESDAEKTAALFNAVVEEGKYTALTEPFTIERQLEFIRRMLAEGVYHVAVTSDGEIIGLQVVLPLSELAAFKHVGDIGTFVSPTSHRSGVGRALAKATFKKAKEVGFTKCMAFIRRDNPRAQAFYKSIGFEEIGIAHRQAFVRGEYIDEVLMERFI